MGNHYHFLLKTKRANLSKSMQWFGATYTRRFNNRHKRGGHLFQGRFKNFLVENDNYLFRLSCYIHRNPLRAEIVTRLADYKWSSYASYAYGKRKHGWLNTDPILSQFGGSSKVKREKYRSKVQNYSGEEKNCGKISDMVLSWAQPVLWMRSARNIFRTNFTRRNPNSVN
jgi:putative transposase